MVNVLVSSMAKVPVSLAAMVKVRLLLGVMSAVTLSVSHDHLLGGVTAVPLQAGTIRGILTYRSEEYGG